MEELCQKTFKDLEDLLKEIAEKYFLAKKITSLQNADYLAEEDYSQDSLYLFLEKVEKAYLSLNETEQNLINNEFFYQSYYEWWKPLYSKATFYRYKKCAMEKFLGVFYEE